MNERIRQRILEIREAKQREAERRQRLLNRLELYHFTDRRNLPSIRENGGIYSLAQLAELEVDIAASGGDENSQHSDRSNGMDGHVHLCLRDEHPMEYRARTAGRIESSIFISVSNKVLELDGVRFVPGMSNTTGIETYPLEEAVRDGHLDELHVDALYTRTDWSVAENYNRRVRAEKFEIIVPDFIPLELLKLPNG
jgi:hypothetical protein